MDSILKQIKDELLFETMDNTEKHLKRVEFLLGEKYPNAHITGYTLSKTFTIRFIYKNSDIKWQRATLTIDRAYE